VLARAVTGERAERDVVAVDGVDGSGKSQFAAALAAACQEEGAGPVIIFRVDDFRRPMPPVPADTEEAVVYYDAYYDFALLKECLAKFLAGAAAVTIPRFDPRLERLEGTHEISFADARLAIVEGVFVLRATSLTRASLVVLEVNEAEARRRIMERDVAKGRTREVVEHRMNKRYFPAQRRYRAAFDPARAADVVVDNADWSAPRIVRAEPARLPPLVARALARVVRS
jgi:uridine kinase